MLNNMFACASVIGIIPYNSKINLASTIDKRDLKANVNILIHEFYFSEVKNHFGELLYLNGLNTSAYNWAEITFKAKPNIKVKMHFENQCYLTNDIECRDGRFYVVDHNDIHSVLTGIGKLTVIKDDSLDHNCTINDLGNTQATCLIGSGSNYDFDLTTDSNGLIKILFIECWQNLHYMKGIWKMTSYLTGNSISVEFNTY